ncbi:hypothetical protein [Parvularcula sp. IMCC14364]|uniref:hypothetical protein n=1 Tax=Parvularcula sp. IMCC14364 TaxID=3067902 RepID=UPI002740C84D|nr:hypothetical protein [Parvularcula sp. IMCC14364]
MQNMQEAETLTIGGMSLFCRYPGKLQRLHPANVSSTQANDFCTPPAKPDSGIVQNIKEPQDGAKAPS